MFFTRMIRPTWIRSLSSDKKRVISCRACRYYLTKCKLHRTICHNHSSELSLSVKKSLVNSPVRSYGSKTGLQCWNCKANIEITNFSCANCGVLQPPNPKMTYFHLMAVPENFDLDLDDISIMYKTLQKIFHPDKFVLKSKEEKDISDNYSRLVNKAYSVLKNPLSRGMYILNLKGLSTEDESVKMNQSFLMDILEKNEEVENLKDAETLMEFEKSNSKTISEYVSEASKAFQKNDLQEAREVLMKMKYFVNIENELKKKKSAMGIVD